MVISLNREDEETIFWGYEHHMEWFEDRKNLIQDMSETISYALKELGLKKKHVSLVGLGMSGALSVPLISHNSRIPFALIRHAGERTVCSNKWPIVGELRPRAIFIDDLIASGSTIRRAEKILSTFSTELVGAVTMEMGVGSSVYKRKITIKKKDIPVWFSGE